MKELCIIFLHHADNVGTRLHAKQLKKLNPNAAFVALTIDNGIEGHIRPKDFQLSQLTEPIQKAEQCDLMVWAWWRSSDRVEAERYVIVESDTLALEPFRWFHSRVWDEPFSCAYVNDRADYPDNHWYTQIKQPVGNRHPLVVWPITCMMFSREAMAKVAEIVHDPWYHPLMCELRIGTAVQAAGYTPKIIRPDVRDYIWWLPRHPSKWMCWGIWHSVKEWLPIHERL